MTKKACAACLQTKAVEFFNRMKQSRDGLQSRCRECQNEYGRKHYAANREKRRADWDRWYKGNREKVLGRPGRAAQLQAAALKRLYGMTPQDYEAMFADQGGACALCRRLTEKRLHVDHDHQTGQVRGLLCSRCNTWLGQAQDDPAFLRRATDYLKANLARLGHNEAAQR